MSKITIYTSQNCPYCVQAKMLLDTKKAAYTEIRIDTDSAQREIMLTRSNGKRTVPQIFIDDLHVGGCDDLYVLDKAGKLDPLLVN